MVASTLSVRSSGGFVLQAGCVNKNAVSVRVRLPRALTGSSAVIVTPMWDHRDSEVGHVETITNIDGNSFTLRSGNKAPDYFVNWLAISGD